MPIVGSKFMCIRLLHGKCVTQNTAVPSITCTVYYLLFSVKFFHNAACLTARPKLLPKPVLQTVRASASFFNFLYRSLSSRSSSNCLLLLLRLPVTSLFPYIFPSVTRFRRQFLREMWPFQLALVLFTAGRIFLSCLTQNKPSKYIISLTWFPINK